MALNVAKSVKGSNDLLQGQLYVIGGSNGHSDELSCGEKYDPRTDEWTQVPELRTNRCNAGRSTACMSLFLCLEKMSEVFNDSTHRYRLLKASAP